MSELARRLMRDDELDQYDAYVAMGKIDLRSMLRDGGVADE